MRPTGSFFSEYWKSFGDFHEPPRAQPRGDKLAQLRHGLAADVAEFVVELPAD